MDFETAIEKVYGKGTFCIIFAICLSLLTSLMAFEFQSIVFLGFSNDFNCSDERILNASSYIWISRETYNNILSGENFTKVVNDSNLLEQCYALITSEIGNAQPQACEKFAYDSSMMYKTLATDYDLVCDRKRYANGLVSATMVASAFGHFIAAFTDQFRRRRIIIFYMLTEIFWSILTPLSTNLSMVFICRIMRVLSIPLCFITMSTLYEILPANKRTTYGNFYWTPYCLGYLATAGLAYLTRDWRLFRYYGLLALIIYIPIFLILLESPRWLFLNGKYEEYHKILSRLAKWNGVKLPEGFVDNLAEPTNVDKNSESVIDLLRSPNVRRVLTAFCSALGAVSCCYFGLSTSVNSAVDDVFLNVFILGLSELPACLTGWILCNYFNRRNSYIIASAFTIASFLIAPLTRSVSDIANIVIVSIGKLMVTVEYNIILLHTAEFFPTSVRNMGFFLVMAIGTAMGGLAPYINDLSMVSSYLPGVVYASVSIVATIMVHFILPNTKNCPLPQTISQVESLKRGNEEEWIKAMRKAELELVDK